MFQKIVCIIFFADHCTQNLSFTGELVYFYSMECFLDSNSQKQTNV